MIRQLFIIIFLGLYTFAFSQNANDIEFIKRATSALLKVPQDSALMANTLLSEILKLRIEKQIAEKKQAEALKLAEKQAASKGDSVKVNPSRYAVDSLAVPKSIDFDAEEETRRLAASGYRSSLDDDIVADLPTTTVEWRETSYDFGEIKTGKEVTHRFTFVNTGENDFVIARVKPSCGCTTTDYTKIPVPTGESGFVEIVFNSTGKYGKQEKHVTVIGNFAEDTQQQLIFEGLVVEKKGRK